LRSLISEDHVRAHRGRGLTPDRPVLRGTAQNPDVFFQAREAANRYHEACPGVVENSHSCESKMGTILTRPKTSEL
jgi:pyruvate-ferredoxin/flavodoxin oxidoreductase